MDEDHTKDFKNSTIPVSITHHWNLIPSNIAKIREKLHSFIHLLIHISFFLFRFKLPSFIFSFKFHSLFFFSFELHSFIHLGAFVGGLVACLDVLLRSASRRSLGAVCVCVRAKITGDCVPESENKSRFASMQSHEFRRDPNPGIAKISRTFKLVFFLFILSNFRRNPTARWS
jgi:hypothetical protein